MTETYIAHLQASLRNANKLASERRAALVEIYLYLNRKEPNIDGAIAELRRVLNDETE